ncbi:hypothetical protein EDD17DRAFT_1559560 [Pisolithus thermaeus]|nr:hypothetical protein EDD17DRAFT_1559560 [Pisolithus thermaeus]
MRECCIRLCPTTSRLDQGTGLFRRMVTSVCIHGAQILARKMLQLLRVSYIKPFIQRRHRWVLRRQLRPHVSHDPQLRQIFTHTSSHLHAENFVLGIPGQPHMFRSIREAGLDTCPSRPEELFGAQATMKRRQDRRIGFHVRRGNLPVNPVRGRIRV